MTSKRCKDWCDTFASVYPVKSYCSDECKAAGRSINEKDKPEAGLTCAIDPDDGCYATNCDACRPAATGKVLCSQCEGSRSVFVGGSDRQCPMCKGWGVVIKNARPLNSAPRPVERCSCEESVALRKALDRALALLGSWVIGGRPLEGTQDFIARRALALGGDV